MPPLLYTVWNGSRGSHRETVRRCASVGVLLAYVVIAVGVPLPSGKSSFKGGELFPCMTSACGCHSAEKCWRSCCCHTLAERLEWARAHGIRPPEFALAEARQSGLDVSWLADTSGVKRIGATCPVAKADGGRHSCCANHQSESPPSPSKDDRVIGWRALSCHGQSLNWLAAVPTLVTVELNISDQLPLVAWLGPHSSEVAAGDADVPTPPPPERA